MRYTYTDYKFILFFAFFFCSIFSLSAQDYINDSYTTDKSYEQLVKEANKYFDEVGKGRGVGYKAFKRWEYWAKRNLNKDGRIILEDFTRKEFNQFVKDNPQTDRAITGTFTEMGPLSAINTSTWSSHLGRITSVAVDPNDSAHIIVGAPNGGVWKTTNTGGTWTPLFNYESLIKIFAVEISHTNSNHYFAGTAGGGIYYSTDGGLTWSQSSGENNGDTLSLIHI